ncbi:Rieske 2Fe-2S domain-containing protein [Rhizobium sp. RU36D]|uniref:Rieske 2Fe-2S domain-containing protein n=1 Tax=Rhizobium sp. RU36D TaxID=1907415 RepID=UPI0009D7E56E|nr:Rieske 2Fe-2S domain-containing protein [Rhizobium sp. RU36D]SMD18204.1 Rieske [2Fe-2S] domain-containing protein [Rhizobium sp. RU36D]
MKRLDELTSPVEIGKYYLVPTVRAEWSCMVRDWPVIGPKHNDRHCLGFDHDHYHIDPRFVPEFSCYGQFWRLVGGSPIMSRGGLNPHGLPTPVWRRRMCKRLANPELGVFYELASRSPQWHCHFREWTGRRARRSGQGWMCPHRNVSLVDQAPVDGVITCPLHLLRIDAATGVVLPPPVIHEVVE